MDTWIHAYIITTCHIHTYIHAYIITTCLTCSGTNKTAPNLAALTLSSADKPAPLWGGQSSTQPHVVTWDPLTYLEYVSGSLIAKLLAKVAVGISNSADMTLRWHPDRHLHFTIRQKTQNQHYCYLQVFLYSLSLSLAMTCWQTEAAKPTLNQCWCGWDEVWYQESKPERSDKLVRQRVVKFALIIIRPHGLQNSGRDALPHPSQRNALRLPEPPLQVRVGANVACVLIWVIHLKCIEQDVIHVATLCQRSLNLRMVWQGGQSKRERLYLGRRIQHPRCMCVLNIVYLYIMNLHLSIPICIHNATSMCMHKCLLHLHTYVRETPVYVCMCICEYLCACESNHEYGCMHTCMPVCRHVDTRVMCVCMDVWADLHVCMYENRCTWDCPPGHTTERSVPIWRIIMCVYAHTCICTYTWVYEYECMYRSV